MQRNSRWWFLLTATALVLMTAAQGWACCDPTTTPAVLQFGPGANTGLTCSGGSDVALGCGLAPNPTPVNHLDIYFNKSSVSDLETFYLIIGIPVASGGSTPTPPNITRVDTYNPYVPTKDPSPSVNTSGWTPTSCGNFMPGELNPYNNCGFVASSNYGGNSFAAWYAAAAALGLNPAKFALFKYDLSNVEDLGAQGVYDVFFGGNLPVGTMEVAYGCSTNNCPYDCYITPFTNAGQVVPEPSTFMLMAGAGLILLGRAWRKRRS
jgi:hypothetical protein